MKNRKNVSFRILIGCTITLFCFGLGASTTRAQNAGEVNSQIIDRLQALTVKSHEFRGLSALNPSQLEQATRDITRSTVAKLADIREDRSLFITNPDRFGFGFYELMNVLAKRSGSGLGAAELFADWWRGDEARCEAISQKGHPRPDGCETAEGMLQHVRITMQDSDYVIRAIVNRGDLMSPGEGSSDCGEFRVIVEDKISYLPDDKTTAKVAALRASGGLSESDRVKTFLSFEFELPNETAATQGKLLCVAIQRFFRNLTDQDDREAGLDMRKFALGEEALLTADGTIVEPGSTENGGALAIGPVAHPANLGGRENGGGRIATNTLVHPVGKPNVNGQAWRLRVYKFTSYDKLQEASGSYKGLRIMPALLPDSFDLKTEGTNCRHDENPIFSPRNQFFHRKAVFNELGVNLHQSYCLASEQTLLSNFNDSFEVPKSNAKWTRAKTEVANLAKSDLNDPVKTPGTGMTEQQLWSRIRVSSCSGCHGGVKIKEVLKVSAFLSGRMARFTHTLDRPLEEPNAEAEASLSEFLRTYLIPWRCAIMNSVVSRSFSEAAILQAVSTDTAMRNSKAGNAFQSCSAKNYLEAERMAANPR